MVRCLEFTSRKSNAVVFNTIFQGIDIAKYVWRIDGEPWFDREHTELDPWQCKIYSGTEFEKLIHECGDEHITFILICKYNTFEESSAMSLESYDDYVKSACTLAINCVDAYEYIVHSKEEALSLKLYKRIEENGIAEVGTLKLISDSESSYEAGFELPRIMTRE